MALHPQWKGWLAGASRASQETWARPLPGRLQRDGPRREWLEGKPLVDLIRGRG